MDLSEIREALKDTLGTVEGLEVTDLRDNPQPPCAIVYPDTPFPLVLTFDDLEIPKFIVLLLVRYVDTDDAQQQMDRFLSSEGDASVIDVLKRNPTLDGVVSSAAAVELRSYGVLELNDGGIRYLSAELTVEVYA